MSEESLRMPFVIRYLREIQAGSVCEDIILNVDFASTFLGCAGITVPGEFQGRSFRPLLRGESPDDWQTSLYYRYRMHKAHHNVCAHYGIRTRRYKLTYYYSDPLDKDGSVGDREDPEWELFDLESDTCDLRYVYAESEYRSVAKELRAELEHLQEQVGDTPCHL